MREMTSRWHRYRRALMLTKAGADIGTILDRTEDEVREVRQAAQFFELEELTEPARIFAQNELMQKGQGTPQLGLELAFLQSIELHRRFHNGQLTSPMTADAVLQSRSTSAQARSVTPQVAESPVAPENVLPTPATSRQASSSISKKSDSRASLDIRQAHSVAESEEMPGQTAAPPARASAGSSERKEGGATRGAEGKPSLTLEQVKDAWDNVKKRVRPKNPKTAAMLNSFTVIGVEGTLDETVVVIQAAYELHHKYVQEGERAKDVDWALSTEFKQKCRVRLLAPGALPPSSLIFESGSFSLNTAVKETPPRSAHLERSAADSPPRLSEPEAEAEFQQEPPATNGH